MFFWMTVSRSSRSLEVIEVFSFFVARFKVLHSISFHARVTKFVIQTDNRYKSNHKRRFWVYTVKDHGHDFEPYQVIFNTKKIFKLTPIYANIQIVNPKLSCGNFVSLCQRSRSPEVYRSPHQSKLRSDISHECVSELISNEAKLSLRSILRHTSARYLISIFTSAVSLFSHTLYHFFDSLMST